MEMVFVDIMQYLSTCDMTYSIQEIIKDTKDHHLSEWG